jgi:hypothetical protein
MLNSFRSIGMMAAMVVAATAGSTGRAAADTEVKVKNSLGVTVEVNFSGDKGFKPIKEFQSSSAGEARSVGRAAEGTTIHWEAKPKRDQDKTLFATCKGDKKVSGTSSTIEMSKDGCSQSAASVPPPAPSASPAPKPGSNTQADKKPSGSGAGSGTGSGSGSGAGSGAGSGSGSGAGSGSGSAAGSGAGSKSGSAASKTMNVKFDNQMDTTSVTLRIYDDLAGGGATDIDSLPAATLNGKSWNVSHVSTVSFEKDKSGNYFISVSMKCGDKGQGGVKYKGSATTIQIVRSNDGGCELKGVTKL